MVPRKFVDDGTRSEDGVHMVPDDPAVPDGPRRLELGRCGADMIRTFHRMAAEGDRCGRNLVLDHVRTLHPPLLQDCVEAFRGLRSCSSRCARRRRSFRSASTRVWSPSSPCWAASTRSGTTRTPSWSRAMSREIFSHDVFDLVVDIHAHRPEAVPQIIREAIAGGPGRAFPELARRLDAGLAPFAS